LNLVLIAYGKEGSKERQPFYSKGGVSMSSNNGDKLLQAHNQGQEHAGRGVDSPPHSLFRASFNPFVTPTRFGEMEAENEAYYEGQKNHRDQVGG